MAHKNSDIDLNKSLILSKFEEIIGTHRVRDAESVKSEKLNQKLREHVEMLTARVKNLEEEAGKLRRELRAERQKSEARVDKEAFFSQLEAVLNKLDKQEMAPSESWKELFAVLVAEVDTCIQIIEESKKGKNV